MTYRIEQFVRKIASPIIAEYEDHGLLGAGKKDFIKIIKGIKNPSHQEGEEIKKIINNEIFIEMIKNIMKSNVMNDVYNIILRLYSTDGKYDYNKEMTEDEKQINDSQNNLINGQPITYYYHQFCNSMQKLFYSNRFIVMALPEEIKGFTFRFLKIIINTEGVNIESKKTNIDDSDKNILLRAYLVFIVIHELNHFMKRQFNLDSKIDVCKTPKIKGFDDPDTIINAPETRTSSPVRIVRGEDLQSVSVAGIYPCGEGAGYAGGITSSAIDGIKVFEKLYTGYRAD